MYSMTSQSFTEAPTPDEFSVCFMLSSLYPFPLLSPDCATAICVCAIILKQFAGAVHCGKDRYEIRWYLVASSRLYKPIITAHIYHPAKISVKAP